MRIGAVPESFFERILLLFGLVPTPILDTQMAYTLARTVMLGVQANIFEALASGPLSSEEVSERCGTHHRATRKLLDALVAARYLSCRRGGYALTSVPRKWLLKTSPQSLRDKLLLQFEEWDWVSRYGEFLRTGNPIRIHQTMSEDGWGVYQRGMRSLASFWAPEVARRTPIPAGARDLLDIGGAHGYYSVALCRRHPAVRATILDLPQAVVHARKILDAEEMDGRITLRAGNALSDELGIESWDVVFAAQLVHHFDEKNNRDLVTRVARSLRPGGFFVVQEMIRPSSPGRDSRDRAGALLDFYFAATSDAGTWSIEEIAGWQREAGLVPRKPQWLRCSPGAAQQVGVKPAQREGRLNGRS
ncbi:MAG: methyltransferase [Vicinamibacteria bacterium]